MAPTDMESVTENIWRLDLDPVGNIMPKGAFNNLSFLDEIEQDCPFEGNLTPGELKEMKEIQEKLLGTREVSMGCIANIDRLRILDKYVESKMDLFSSVCDGPVLLSNFLQQCNKIENYFASKFNGLLMTSEFNPFIYDSIPTPSPLQVPNLEDTVKLDIVNFLKSEQKTFEMEMSELPPLPVNDFCTALE